MDHFNMATKLGRDLKYIMDAYRGEGEVEPDYFNTDDEAGVDDWVDYAFHWLTDKEAKAFHLPGPSLGKRSEFVVPVHSLWSDIMFAVARDTEDYDEYEARLGLPCEWLCLFITIVCANVFRSKSAKKARRGNDNERIPATDTGANAPAAAASSAPVPGQVGSGSNRRGTEPPTGPAPAPPDAGPPIGPAPAPSNAGAIQPPTGPAPAANPPRKFVFECACTHFVTLCPSGTRRAF